MLQEERQNKILGILNKEKSVITSDLSSKLNVSKDTVRRDLRTLEKKGFLTKVHSGAIRKAPPIYDFDQRKNINLNEKKTIAKKTLPLIKNNSTILIDAGTTNLALIKQLPNNFQATVITNNLAISTALAYYPNIEAYTLGGKLYKQSMINTGELTISELQNIRADIYITGIYGIDKKSGLSVPTFDEAIIKKQMIADSKEIVAMITHEKFNTVSHNIIAPINCLDYIVTNNKIINKNSENNLKDYKSINSSEKNL